MKNFHLITNKEKLTFLNNQYGGLWRFPEIKDYHFLVNPYFPPVEMQEEIKSFFYELISQYPSGLNVQNSLASQMLSIKTANILVGNGASEIIRGIGNILDGKFGIVFPTFNEYYESLGEDRVIKFIPSSEDFTYSLDDLIKLSNRSDHLILINPDNPSGNFNKKYLMLELLDHMIINNKKLIIDESFIDFAKNGDSETLISQDIIDKYPNLIIIKSIGKSYGVPGIRLGVIVSSNINLLNKVRNELTIWNINSFGEFFLQIIGKYRENYKEACMLIQCERDKFYNDLKNISFLKVYSSQANYFLCRLLNGYSTTKFMEALINKNIYIKDLSNKIGCMNGEYVRLTVRNKKDNKLLISTLKELENNKQI
jgi:histidinol-phosphate/aromatic aminotransferase/cobyric acid decarboxylase-like protein